MSLAPADLWDLALGVALARCRDLSRRARRFADRRARDCCPADRIQVSASGASAFGECARGSPTAGGADGGSGGSRSCPGRPRRSPRAGSCSRSSPRCSRRTRSCGPKSRRCGPSGGAGNGKQAAEARARPGGRAGERPSQQDRTRNWWRCAGRTPSSIPAWPRHAVGEQMEAEARTTQNALKNRIEDWKAAAGERRNGACGRSR